MHRHYVLVDKSASKRSLKQKILGTFALLVLAGVCMYYFSLPSSPLPLLSQDGFRQLRPTVRSSSNDVEEKNEPGLPLRLKIPKIKVDAAIDQVGLTPQKDMGEPKGPDSTGWYKDGPRPGAEGSAVIDGHFGWVNGRPAVFDNLHTLQKGDTLHTEDDRGVSTKFIVSGSRLYSPNEDATAVFRTTDGRVRLNLITCQGSWNKSQQSYATRLVVFAIKE